MAALKIERVEFAAYCLPLARTHQVGSTIVDERDGRLVRLTSDTGLTSYGEIAPLPGLHKETVTEAERMLQQVGAGLAGQDYENFAQLAEDIGERVSTATPGATPDNAREGVRDYPSVCFGLQAAGAALFARAQSTTPAGIWGRAPRATVALNALFSGGPDEAEQAAADGSLKRFPAVKVKVGRRSIQEDRRILQVLCDHLPKTTTLRLDANRALSLQDALERLHGLPPERVDYLEEPLSNPNELAELHARTGLRMGLDETLHESGYASLRRAPHVTAWIMKPALIGNWERIRCLAEDAEKHGKAVVISSTLESGLGLWSLAQLAAALPGADVPAGLATDPWLASDLISPRYDSSPGFVGTADWVGTPAPQVLERLRFHQVG